MPNNNMRYERVRRFLTLEQVAKSIGVHPNALARWERGESEPTSSNLVELARYYDVTAEYLLGVTDNRDAAAVAPAN